MNETLDRYSISGTAPLCPLTSSGRLLRALFADGECHNVPSVTEGVRCLAQVTLLQTLAVDGQNDVTRLESPHSEGGRGEGEGSGGRGEGRGERGGEGGEGRGERGEGEAV